jgi:long-chain acyl-CoA synthetase
VLNKTPHRTVVYLPLSHVIGKTATLTLPLLTDVVPHFGENIEILEETMFETAPTVLFTVPVYLKKFASNVFVGIEKSSPLKKWICRKALKLSHLRLKALWRGEKNGLLTVLDGLCRHLVFNRILNKMGMNDLKIVLSTDSPLPAGIMTQWQALGVKLCECYTLTEAGGGLISGQSHPFSCPGEVGTAPTGWEVSLSEEGEILVRSDDFFTGYWEDPELTESVVDVEGWFHTGDMGMWTPEGRLQIIDRKKNIETGRDGCPFSPNRIETALRSSHYISEAVVFRLEGGPACALIEIDFESVSTWARFHDVPHAEYLSLVERPEVIDLFRAEVEEANRDLGPQERVSCFRLMPNPLSGREEPFLLTPTRKVRRDRVFSQYKGLLESMNH